MDPDVAEKARSVFAALSSNDRSLEEILASDFANWRMFFRFVKDALADPTTALGELNATSFLGKHDISVSAWGKSVKERSPLFKEEFEKFMLIERVREALAADLGMETPPSVADEDASVAAVGEQPDGVVETHDESSLTNASHAHIAPDVPSNAPPPRVASSPRGATGREAPANGAAPGAARVHDVAEPDVSAAFHRERVLAYLDGFKTLLLDLRSKVDEIATANVLTVAGAVERAESRLETALARVDAMTAEETEVRR